LTLDFLSLLNNVISIEIPNTIGKKYPRVPKIDNTADLTILPILPQSEKLESAIKIVKNMAIIVPITLMNEFLSANSLFVTFSAFVTLDLVFDFLFFAITNSIH
jgi:hypothetical protein